MKALFFDQKLKFIDDYPIPTPKEVAPLAPDEALIKVKLAGICRTDLEITKGYMDFKGVLGHEFVGVVEECRQGDWVGKRVVGEINCCCGKCEYCNKASLRQGLKNHCPNRSVLGIHNRGGLPRYGAFAEYLTLPVENLHLVPDEVSDEEAVFVEPLAASCRILEQVQFAKTEACLVDEVIILGDGKLGLLVAQVINLTGCNLNVVGKYESKLAILEKRGINTILLHQTNNLKQMHLVADIVIDCTGRMSGFEMAQQIVKPMGKIILKSTIVANSNINLSSLVVNEITLIGSRCGPFKQAIELLRDKKVEVTSLISATYPLEEGLVAFEKAQDKEALKILLKM
ncbi:MAG: alcohol dehydrogenase catalytic domain-containing protein [Nitrospirota bacterium]